MAETPRPAGPRTYAWWLVLCVVGLDYFSTLAYLPSIAVEAVGLPKGSPPWPRSASSPSPCWPPYPSTSTSSAVRRTARARSASWSASSAAGSARRSSSSYSASSPPTMSSRSLSVADAAVHLTHDPFWREMKFGPDLVRTQLPAGVPAWVSDLRHRAADRDGRSVPSRIRFLRRAPAAASAAASSGWPRPSSASTCCSTPWSSAAPWPTSSTIRKSCGIGGRRTCAASRPCPPTT